MVVDGVIDDEEQMKPTVRHKPLAQCFLFGMAGLMTGGHAVDVQAEPLRIDPALLAPELREVAQTAREVSPGAAPGSRAEAAETAQTVSAPANAQPTAALRAPQPTPTISTPAPASSAAVDSSAPPARPATEAASVSKTPVAVLPTPPASTASAAPSSAPASRPAVPAVVTAPAPAAVVDADTSAVSARPANAAPRETAAAERAALPRVDPSLLGDSSAHAASPGQAASPSSSEMPAASAAAPATPTEPAAVVRNDRAQSAEVTAAAATPVMGRRIHQSADDRGWLERMWSPVANAYHNGALELYLPFLTHHLRSQYSAEKIATYRENPLGFGIGSGLYDAKGNWDAVYAMAFQDSHSKPMYMVGYGWQAIWRPVQDTRVGLGYTAGLISRSDIWGYKPFPVVLPIGSIAYRNFSLNGTFIPGGRGWGNVAFFWAKWEFGKAGERVGTPAPASSAAPELAGTYLGPFVAQEYRRLPYGPVVTGDASVHANAGSGGLIEGSNGGVGVAVAGASAGMPAASSASSASWALPADAGSGTEARVADTSPALALRRSAAVSPAASAEREEERPAFLSAQRVGGDGERELTAEGDAELRKVDVTVNADRMTYWPVEDEVEAEGRVRLAQGQDTVTGPKMRLKLEDQVGFFEQPEFSFKRSPQSVNPSAADVASAERYLEQRRQNYWRSGFAMPLTTESVEAMSGQGQTMSDVRGDAGRIDFEGENQYRLSDSRFTTCAPDDDSWYLRSRELKLDYDYEQGESRASTLYFKNVPILYWPNWSFSLNRQRKSGLLTPSFGMSSSNGVTLSVPYYWNIAPNRDATITTRLISKRGIQFDVLGRYLNTAWGGRYEGEGRVEYLPGDRLYDNKNRYGIAFSHRQFIGNGFAGEVNYNRVSDDHYFTDLSSHVAATSQTQLLQQAKVGYYGGGWWNATVDFQGYQTLQPDANNPVLEQYRMLPQITLNARKADLYSADASFMGQFTAFSKPQQIINGTTVAAPEGRRLVLYPQLSLPYVRPGWYITPKLGLNIRHYSLSNREAGTPKSISSTLPIMSLDSGMTFERDSRWFGKDYRQTLEPRLYYVNIPYRNQDAIPIFDTALADFDFAQLFSENQFSGWDRINNANQLTTAVSSRLLEPNSGAEIARATIGQRFYFTRNKVGLSANSIAGSEDRNWDKSDFLTAFSGQVLPRVYADFASQYDVSDRQVKRLSAGVRYLPAPGKVLNLSYHYNRDPSAPVKQIDLSGQWPLTGRLYAVGRYNYSFRDDGAVLSTVNQRGRLIQAIAGLEYNGGCWVARGVVQRLALTSEKASSAFFLQLELNDFASIGSNPIDMLRRNIRGYSLINEPVKDSIYVH